MKKTPTKPTGATTVTLAQTRFQPKPKRMLQLFFDTEGTNHDALWRYARKLPEHLDTGYFEGISEHSFAVLCDADFVEILLKHYICGHHKRLHKVNFAIRRFLKRDEVKARDIISEILRRTQAVLLHHEFYELLGRFDVARKRINKRFGI